MFYLYEWFIIETNEIIYVGKGVGNRYKAKKKNNMLNEFLSRFNCDYRITKHFESETEAFESEKERIDELKKIGQCVCNKMPGGYGGKQSIWTSEKRNKMSVDNPMHDEQQRKRMSEKNPMKDKDIATRVGILHRRAVVINGTEYPSVKSAAEELNVAGNTISAWAKQGHDAKWNPCRYADEPQKQFVKKIHCARPVWVDDMLFRSVKEAAEHVGVDSTSLIRHMQKNKLCKGHKCRYDNQQPSHTNPIKVVWKAQRLMGEDGSQ